MTIPMIQADTCEMLNEERKTSLAFILKASRADHGGIIDVATKILRGEIEKAVRNEHSVYGAALRTHKRIVFITLDGKKCMFGNPEGTWGEAARAAVSGLSQIVVWARWRQNSIDILNTTDLAARELLSKTAVCEPNMKVPYFARSVGRVFDVPEDIKMANEARKPFVAPPVATLDDLADATLDLAAANVEHSAELEAIAMEAISTAEPVVETPQVETHTVEENTQELEPVLAGHSSPQLQAGLAATEVLNTLRRAGYWSPSATPEQNRRKLESLMATHERLEAQSRKPARRRI